MDEYPVSAEMVIAIDGKSGVGKSSTSRGVASALGLCYLDTGATYRALTWWLLEHGVDIHDEAAVAASLGGPRIEVGTDPAAPWTRVDGIDVSAAIREPRIDATVSTVARMDAVRAHLIAMQRSIIEASGGIVVEGRDIGTKVADDAPLKLVLTASGAAAAERRGLETDRPVGETFQKLERRDAMDAAQSGIAADAVVFDTTSMGLDQVIDRIVAMAQRVRHG